MIINTINFGELVLSPEKIIRAEAGLMGFEDHTDYVLVSNTDAEGNVPFWWLQSCKDPSLALVVTVPFLFEPAYEVELSDEIIRQLEIQHENDVEIYTVCKIPERFDEMTINLKSPIVINVKNHKAVQLVMHNSEYRVNESAVKK